MNKGAYETFLRACTHDFFQLICCHYMHHHSHVPSLKSYYPMRNSRDVIEPLLPNVGRNTHHSYTLIPRSERHNASLRDVTLLVRKAYQNGYVRLLTCLQWRQPPSSSPTPSPTLCSESCLELIHRNLRLPNSYLDTNVALHSTK